MASNSMANGAVSLIRVFGIDIQLHWTFVLLLLISLYLGIVSNFNFFLFFFIVLLFAMVVIHELAHSITSIKSGFPVKKIILIPLGGASIIDLDSMKPETQFRIALAGPLMSIVLAMLFGTASVYMPAGFLSLMFQLLFLLNIILGVFNLLPAFPLDGGRVLKSYLERKRDSFSATKLAVKISNVILALFIIGTIFYYGLIPGISISYFSFVVLFDFVVVLFLYGGAQSELQAAYVEKYTSTLRVSDAISKNYITAKHSTKMRDLYELFLKKGTHIVIYRKNGKVFLVSKLIMNPSAKNAESMLDKSIEDFSTEIPAISKGEKLSRAISKMRFEEANIVAVVDGPKIAGILYGPHVESVVALHIPKNLGGRAAVKDKSN
ncbi:MAG: site-2 protease family protein [Candidatus Marsarchaeota archaeon]|nr:site-2 protease family protein [Candidatus Marsarchaeota archaeon]